MSSDIIGFIIDLFLGVFITLWIIHLLVSR